MKEFLKRHMLVIKYLFFGVGTTVLGWGVYFAILFTGRAIAGIPVEETAGTAYFAVYTTAQVTQWIITVLFAFFTNRKWVFIDYDRSESTLKQLSVFAGGRVLTFVMDYAVTYFGALLLCEILPIANCVPLFGREWNLNEIGAKLVSAVLVIIGNYFFSKKLVFKNNSEK